MEIVTTPQCLVGSESCLVSHSSSSLTAVVVAATMSSTKGANGQNYYELYRRSRCVVQRV